MDWSTDGSVADNGMPIYTETLMIQLDRPPLLSLTRVATEEDIETYDEPYKLFQKMEKSRKTKAVDGGYPLALWPVVNPFELQMLAARDIYTVEQLAKFEKRKDVPPEFLELAQRAAEMIKMQNSGAKYEPIIRDLNGQIEVLKEQVTDCMKTIAAQKELIRTLKIQAA
jgi:hypothetical protein